MTTNKMSLAAAAAVAYAALRQFMQPGNHRPPVDEYEEALQLLATHISLVAPIYGATSHGAEQRLIPRDVAAQGRFVAGGLRLVFDDGRPAFVDLSLQKTDLDPIIDKLCTAYGAAAGSASRRTPLISISGTSH